MIGRLFALLLIFAVLALVYAFHVSFTDECGWIASALAIIVLSGFIVTYEGD